MQRGDSRLSSPPACSIFSLTGRNARMMRRLSRIAAAFVPVLLSLALVVQPSPAQANSATGLANNAWLVTDLAVQAAGAYQTPAAQYASAAELAAASTATVASTPKPGFTAKPAPSSKLGLVVNGIAVLGTAVWAFNPFDEDAPVIPGGAESQVYGGSPSVGWSYGPARQGDPTLYGSSSTDQWFSYALFPTNNGRKSSCTRRISLDTGQALTNWSCGSTSSGTGLIRVQRESYAFKVEVAPGYYCGNNVVAPCTYAGDAYLIDANNVLMTLQVPSVGGTLADPSVVSAPETTPRYIDSTVTCKSPGGGSQVLTRTDGPFTFDPAVGADLPVEVPSMECPPGTWLDSGSRDMRTDGVTDTVPMEVYDAPPWVETQVVRFPDCFPVGGSPCELALVFIGTGGAEKECSSYALGAENPCYQWLRQPDRDTKFGCKFGPYSIGLRACRPLKDRFNPTPLTSPSSPSDPANPDPDEPEPPYDPDAPPVDPTPDTTPDLNADGCIPSGWNLLNPFAYMKATACALKWAFLPDPGFLSSRLDELRLSFLGTEPGAWVSAFTGEGITWPSASCEGIPVAWTTAGQDFSFTLLRSCDGAMATAANVARLVGSAFLVVFGAVGCLRALGAGFGWSPGIGRGGVA